MTNIYSNIIKVNNKNIARSIKYLKKNETVAVPTETVYGLAGMLIQMMLLERYSN